MWIIQAPNIDSVKKPVGLLSNHAYPIGIICPVVTETNTLRCISLKAIENWESWLPKTAHLLLKMLLKPTLEVVLLSLALICTLLQNSQQELIQGKKSSVGTFAL